MTETKDVVSSKQHFASLGLNVLLCKMKIILPPITDLNKLLLKVNIILYQLQRHFQAAEGATPMQSFLITNLGLQEDKAVSPAGSSGSLRPELQSPSPDSSEPYTSGLRSIFFIKKWLSCCLLPINFRYSLRSARRYFHCKNNTPITTEKAAKCEGKLLHILDPKRNSEISMY